MWSMILVPLKGKRCNAKISPETFDLTSSSFALPFEVRCNFQLIELEAPDQIHYLRNSD